MRVSLKTENEEGYGPKPATAVWLLRCSVFRETPMASVKNIQFQKAKMPLK
jgi:hypothetical protein